MFVRTLLLATVAASMVLVDGRLTRAETPWSRLALFRRVEAEQGKAYPLTQEHGPWLIMAVTFSGEDAEAQAQELVYVIRKEYKLPAYMHEMSFDHADETSVGRLDQYGRPKRLRYRVDEVREIGVLVGNFPSIDDPEARCALEQLKYAWPDCMDPARIIENEQKISRPLAAFRMLQNEMLPKGSLAKRRGPMGHAFMVPNPLLPPEYFVPRGIDKLVMDMNQGIEHSLLDCPGAYTVRVASFNGTVVLDQKKIQQIESGAGMPSRLEQAALDAHKLCAALRAKGYEAYEFHDRTSSIVTVGSFDSVGSPRTDGKIEINPQIHRIMETFGADRSIGGGQTQVGQAKNVAGIPLDIQALPIEVPKRSVVVDYDLLGFGGL